MAAILGSVPISGFVAPTDSTDIYATHDEEYGRGGYRSVATIVERDAIPVDRRKEGMKVYVNDTGTEYQLIGGITDTDWTEVNSSTTATPCVNMEPTDLILFMRNGNLMSATIEQFKCVLSSIDAGGAIPICEANISDIIDGGFLSEAQTGALDGGESTQIIVSSVDGGASN